MGRRTHECSTRINYKTDRVLFKCGTCSYKSYYDNKTNKYVVLNKGDVTVYHSAQYANLINVEEWKKQ
jgi:hypothetical protein